MWEKFVYLAPFAAFTGAARLPIGPLRADPLIYEQIMAAVGEVESVARAEGVAIRDHASLMEYVTSYVTALPATTRSSLLIDLQMGKRLELEALPGSVVRRGRAAGVPTPIMSALYSVLKPHANGAART
jgi:2-dehydropantoate 2-reductase